MLLENWLRGQKKQTATGTTSTCTTSSKVAHSSWYSTTSLRIRPIIVQLVTNKVIHNRLHGFYQTQQSLTAYFRIHWVDYCKVICKGKKYRGYTNYISKLLKIHSHSNSNSLNTCLICIKIRHYPISTHTQIHACKSCHNHKGDRLEVWSNENEYVNDMPWVKFTTNSYLRGKYVC